MLLLVVGVVVGGGGGGGGWVVGVVVVLYLHELNTFLRIHSASHAYFRITNVGGVSRLEPFHNIAPTIGCPSRHVIQSS